MAMWLLSFRYFYRALFRGFCFVNLLYGHIQHMHFYIYYWALYHFCGYLLWCLCWFSQLYMISFADTSDMSAFYYDHWSILSEWVSDWKGSGRWESKWVRGWHRDVCYLQLQIHVVSPHKYKWCAQVKMNFYIQITLTALVVMAILGCSSGEWVSEWVSGTFNR